MGPLRRSTDEPVLASVTVCAGGNLRLGRDSSRTGSAKGAVTVISTSAGSDITFALSVMTNSKTWVTSWAPRDQCIRRESWRFQARVVQGYRTAGSTN